MAVNTEERAADAGECHVGGRHCLCTIRLEEEVSRPASRLLPYQLFGNKQLHRPSSETSGASGFGDTEVSDSNACAHLCGSLKELC